MIDEQLMKDICAINKGTQIFLIEEMAELMQAFMKENRNKHNNIREELGDVYCTLMEYCYSHDVPEQELITMAENKIKRALEETGRRNKDD